MSEWIESIESSWGSNKLVYRPAENNDDENVNSIVFRLPSVPGFHKAAMEAPRAKIYKFRTLTQLMDVPEVRQWRDNSDHRRYFVTNGFLMVEFASGMTHCTGGELKCSKTVLVDIAMLNHALGRKPGVDNRPAE